MSQVWRGEDGEPRRGKTVTLDSEDLAMHDEAQGLLRRFIENLETPF